MNTPEPRDQAPVDGPDAVAACRVARAKSSVALSFAVAALAEIAGDVLGLEGGAWAVLQAVVATVFVATLVLWIVLALRAAGGARTWLGPVAIAVAVAAALASLSWLFA